MDSTKTSISLAIPPKIREILAERSVICGMDESSYATKVIIDYLKGLGDETGGKDYDISDNLSEDKQI